MEFEYILCVFKIGIDRLWLELFECCTPILTSFIDCKQKQKSIYSKDQKDNEIGFFFVFPRPLRQSLDRIFPY